jgi:pimeloyl-ACP methyl ester carboxylesterase
MNLRFLPKTLTALVVLATLSAGCGEGGAESGGAPSANDTLPKKTISLSTGITMKYVELGAESGETVVFLHGFTDSARSFHPTMQALAQAHPELRLIALDQRGHGGSSMPDPKKCRAAPETCFQPAELANDVIAFLDAQKLDRVHVVGHSMGSLVAQELALDHPERIERAVLIGTSTNLKDNPVLRDFFALGVLVEWQKAIEQKGLVFPDDAYELTPYDALPDAETWMATNWVADPTADPEFIAAIVPETSRVPLGTWIGGVRAMLEFDSRARLQTITVPTLSLWASQDSIFPASPDQEELRAALDAAATSCLAGYFWKPYGKKPLPASGLQEDELGHNLQWGAPDEVAKDLGAYLTGGAPTSDFYFADPADIQKTAIEPGAAMITSKTTEMCPP